ncbi:ABC transporter ATP-binding protein [Gramella jeungdoensis]|uniref:ABC transporter ATP-binding protein n=1 Tax=Gramella jeungdoensis TaxID=708091 RepID=A0ABT0Z0E4_9FLAO|nr:ABC transporter ATP-binding protein [Gramella jeungdoensis]MCM8569197.1 ABC transporter ATP-binding protein [Gramella jeungdoensis]
MSIILTADNISKQYRLGEVGVGTIGDDLKRWWYNIRGKEDPFLKVGAMNDRRAMADQDYVWALKDISFEVKQGEVLGIIGKNGAGKSTLLKLLSRVTSPTTGVIRTKGRIASLLEIGTGFHPELTGRENIFMNGAVLGMTRDEIKSKLDEIIAFSGCEKYIDTPVKRYSSGMTVRLGFGVAAHLEPEILVIDEVLAVGDAEFQKKAIGKMQDLSTGEGRTVLFVSHNMGSIQQLCSRTLVLENGKLSFTGDAKDGIDFYLNSGIQRSRELLSTREDRHGSGEFRFSTINVSIPEGGVMSTLLSGETYNFEITYKVNVDLYSVQIRLMFMDNRGIVRFLCNNEFSSKAQNLMKTERGTIVCTVPKFPLPNGRYSIRLTCFSSGHIIDDIENAFEFEVAGGNFFGTGKEQGLKEGVLVPNSFTFS